MHRRSQLGWAVAGVALGALISINPFFAPRLPLSAGVGFWFVAMGLALVLCGTVIGARIGALVVGALMAAPCFVWDTPLCRFLLMCSMGLPLAFAAAMLMVEPMPGIPARLIYLSKWCGTQQVRRRPITFDTRSLIHFILATAVLSGTITGVKAVPDSGLWLPARWFVGGVGILAFAEMATACQAFLTGLLGLIIPQFMQSPYLSTSVAEFWSKRWNLVASEMFRREFFRPVAHHSVALGVIAAFAASGAAHVLLVFMAMGRWGISLCCGAFFLVQPVLIAWERRLRVRRWRPAIARVWTLGVLAVVSPLFVEPALQLVENSWGTRDSVLWPTLAVVVFVFGFCSIVGLTSLASVWVGGSTDAAGRGHFLEQEPKEGV